MHNPWFEEWLRGGLILGGAWLAGWLFGYPWPFLFFGLAGYFAWHMRNLARLVSWLGEGRRFQPPESSGIWDEVFQRIYRLQQRNRQRKRKLAKILKRFQQATAALPDATAVLTEQGDIEWWNDEGSRLLGLNYPRDVGARVTNLLRHPAFVQYVKEGDFSRPVQLPSPVDERITLSVRIVPYGKKRRLLVARDISRLTRLEQIRRDFVANVSHELRTPLTVIAGYLETMEEEAQGRDGEDGRWGSALGVMRQQTERMQRIVEDLLMLSRLETDSVGAGEEPVAVPALLAAICDDARRLSGGDGHEIHLEVDETLWLRGAETELRSLFSNLVFNAVRYTPPGGRIDVRWCQDGDQARFSVQDTGIGIAPHHIPRLTERFYRVDVGRSRMKGGTGLGLAIVKHVLLRHQGELEISSIVGEGSRFSALFPQERLLRMEQQDRQAGASR